MSTRSFSARITAWQRAHGRHDLPWQRTRDPYRIWVAEIMLQRTQVATVIPYYERFVAAFPDVRALARADEDAVLAQWSGLGYYRRARHLHAAAREVADHRGGAFPREAAMLATLPGIGRSTAAAIAAFASGERGAILDGNVRRVLARHRGIDGDPTSRVVEGRLWALAQRLVPRDGVEAYTQGMMDLGATVCTRATPRCDACPVAGDCVARRDGRVADLPGRRARRALPHREVQLAWVERAGEVLLERRPASGVWGRLWSLPELEVGADPVASLRARFDIAARLVGRLAPVEHAFTHYALTLHPSRLTARASRRPPPAECMWVARADLAAAALPAPIRKLLRAGVRDADR
ncbi:Adenine DNA glycosylase [Burkholderiales bacterium]|nr:Adenine DNA glycosylase [Burkholderiales bacterium]